MCCARLQEGIKKMGTPMEPTDDHTHTANTSKKRDFSEPLTALGGLQRPLPLLLGPQPAHEREPQRSRRMRRPLMARRWQPPDPLTRRM